MLRTSVRQITEEILLRNNRNYLNSLTRRLATIRGEEETIVFPEEQATDFKWEICESSIQVLVVCFFWHCLTDIERGKRHEDERLEECYEELEEPEWESKYTECSSMERWNLSTNIYDNWDEDCTDEYIEKETHREWSNTDELSNEVEPTNEYWYDLLRKCVSMIVEEIVSEVMHWSLEVKRCKLCYEDNSCREYESCREVWVYRTEVYTEPVPCWYKYEPVKYKSEDIPSENHHHKSSKEPHIPMRHTLVTKESSCISKDTIHNVESECTKTWHLVCCNCDIEESNKEKKNSHKNPSRKNRIGNMDTTNCPIMDDISLRCGNMWTSMLSTMFCSYRYIMCDFWCNLVCDFCCTTHMRGMKTPGVYRKREKMQEEVMKKKNPQELGIFLMYRDFLVIQII